MKKLLCVAANILDLRGLHLLIIPLFSVKTTIFSFVFFISTSIFSQALPISIDSRFDDWTSEAIDFTDAANDGDDIELLRMAVANDADHLFIQVEMNEEIDLVDDQNLTLYIDTDLNSSTGIFINGIGAELEINFGERDVFYKLPSGQGFMSLNEIGLRHQPTVTSSIFEMALDLKAVSNAGFDLFTANGVSLVWKDETGPVGDAMPDNGTVFTYMFDDTHVPEFEPISLEKENSNSIRLITWNTLHNGIDDFDREQYFSKVLNVLNPDIVTFNECWDINTYQVASFMNAAVPLPNFQDWNTIKVDDGNITASRYPILQNWYILPGQRLTASLLDIPDEISDKDLLVINAHFRCCGNDFDRQREADAFVEFIHDAKTQGGIIDLPEGTPFVLSGDLNLVGDSQQLTTLLTGEVVNTDQFGSGGTMDWDESDLLDVISTHADDRFAYTWKNEFSSFPPSRIDFHVVSSSVLGVDKSYTLQTETMSQERLNEYGLGQFDVTIASDHLPKVTDLIMPMPVATAHLSNEWSINAFPNPTKDLLQIAFYLEKTEEINFSLQASNGKVLQAWSQIISTGKQIINIDLVNHSPGIYFLKMNSSYKNAFIKIIKN